MRLANVSRISCALLIPAVGVMFAQVPKKREANTKAQTYSWIPGTVSRFSSTGRAKAVRLKDESILMSGNNPEVDTYTIVFETDAQKIAALRIEALTHESLGGNGPGRSPHGNFVLSEVTASASPKGGGAPVAIRLTRPEADFAQDGFPAANVIDGDPRTGWAIHGSDRLNVNRMLTFTLDKPVQIPGGSRWTITLDQQFGSFHTLGRFRFLLGTRVDTPVRIDNLRIEKVSAKKAEPAKPLTPVLELTPLLLEGKIAVLPAPLGTGNWDFESGLQGWTVGAESGDNRAFLTQPTYGDNIYAQRLRASNVKVMGFDPAIGTKIGGDYWDTPAYTGHQGDWWIGTSEDRPTKESPSGGRGSEWHRGNLTSPDFRIDKPVLSCLISNAGTGGPAVLLQVKCANQAEMAALSQLVIAERTQKQTDYQALLKNQPNLPPPYPVYLGPADGQYLVVSVHSGRGTDVMTRVQLDTPACVRGRIGRYKVVDNSVTGHINVDDFRAGDSLPPDPAPVWGFVDTHSHPMVHKAFGGGVIWGNPGGRLEDSMLPHVLMNDLPNCDGFTHGNAKGAAADHIVKLVGNFMGYGWNLHDAGGYFTGLKGWPAAGGIPGLFHQQMHVQWLKRAFDGGQRIMVAAAITNQLLYRGVKNGFDAFGNKFTTPDANVDFIACMEQIALMKNLANLNSSWMEIVTTPAQARTAIRNNKLAIILAVETDWLNGMDQVKALYSVGVRHITPVHLMDNIFGSSAVYKDFFNSLNFWFNGSIFWVDNGTPLGVNFQPSRAVVIPNFLNNVLTVPGPASGGDLYSHGYTVNDSFPPSAYKFGGYVNRYGLRNYTRVIGGGLQPDPIVAYKEMMRMGMLIDVAHMSHRSVEELLNLVGSQTAGNDSGYPVHSSHGGIREQEDHTNERSLTDAQCRRIVAMGGTLGLGMGAAEVKTAPNTMVPNDCSGTTKSFAQLVQHSNKQSNTHPLTRGLTLGSDFNGLNGMMAPRFGAKKPPGVPAQQDGVRYLNFASPSVAVKSSQPLMRPSTMISAAGTRTFDYNVDGLAHYGLTPDMFQDARNTGLSPDQIGTFFRGAEDFIRMWEKCERLRGSIQ